MQEKKPAQGSKLTPEQLEKTKKYSIIDGSGYNVMMGFGEQYVVPYALRLGASNTEIAILSSVPAFLGAIFQLLGAKLTDNFQSRKKLVIWTVFFHALTLAPMFIVPFITKSVLALTIIFSLYMVFANLPAPAWHSWIGDIIPEDERSAYFARRNRATLTALFMSVLFAGLILNFFAKTNIWLGFAILFNIAFLGRLTSWIFLIKHAEPARERKKSDLTFVKFLETMKHSRFGNFVRFRVMIAFSAMISVPFFSVYMLKTLHFNYIQYSAIILTPMVVKALTATYWGAYSKKFGNRNIMAVSAIMVAAIPFLWFIWGMLFENQAFVFWFILCTEMITGFVWGGFELTTFNYMLETSESETRARLFAYFNVIFGTAILLGGLLSSFLVKYFTENNSTLLLGISPILMVFLLSSIARMLTVMGLMPKVKEVGNVKHVSEKHVFLEVLVARPLGFVVLNTLSTLAFLENNISKFPKEKIKETTDNILLTAKLKKRKAVFKSGRKTRQRK